MKHKFPLTYFFVTSHYSRPKQTMLQVVLLIAFFYLFFQITAVNIVVFTLGNIEEFMVFNLISSNIIVFVLVAYLSISSVFHSDEFNMLAALPLEPKRIVAAKVSSSLLVPIGISIVTQISTVFLLISKLQFVETLKLIIILPLTNLLIALFLLFVLSLVNLFREKIRSTVSYLAINILTVVLIIVAIGIFIAYHFQTKFISVIKAMDISDISSWKNTIILLLNEMNEVFISIPVMSFIVNSFVNRGNNLHFGLIIVISVLIICLLWGLTIINISVNYLKHGVLQMNKISFKKSNLYNGKSEVGYYVQRELWVIQSEAYFKLQIGLSIILPTVFAIMFLMVIQNDWLTSNMTLSIMNYIDQYFAYSIFFISCANNISGTPFSREGRYYNLIHILPFNTRKIYFLKVILASVTSMIGIILGYLIYIAFGYWNIESFLMMVVVIILVLCYNLLTPIYDMNNPSIEWENPSQAIKSNPNVIVSLFYGLPIPILIIGIHSLMLFLGTSSILSIGMLLLVITCLLGVLIWLVKYYLQNKLRKMEERY